MLNRVTIKLGDDDNVMCEVLNGMKVLVNFSLPVSHTIDDFDNIVQIHIGENGLSLFDELSIPVDSRIKSVYRIRKIEKLAERSYMLYSEIQTKTTLFILPCLGDKLTTKEYFLIDTFFENAFLGTDRDKDILGIKAEVPLLLLYRYSESEIYKAFETRIRKHPLFEKSIDITKSEVIFIFNITSFKSDVTLFLNGKYSHLSSELKAKILTFHNFSKHGVMAQILDKSEKLRKQLEMEFNVPIADYLDLYDKPVLSKESYYY